MMQERRRLARKAVAFPIQIRQGNLLIDGIAQDYSPLGLQFQSVGLGALRGDGVTVAFLDARRQTIATFPGSIRWVAGECCGISNLLLSEREG